MIAKLHERGFMLMSAKDNVCYYLGLNYEPSDDLTFAALRVAESVSIDARHYQARVSVEANPAFQELRQEYPSTKLFNSGERILMTMTDYVVLKMKGIE